MAVTWLLEKTGIMGGYTKLSERYDSEKGDATHVRMTVKEYDDLLKRINVAKRNAENAERKQYQAEDQMREGIRQAKKEAEETIEEGRKAIAAEVKQLKDDKVYAENEREQLLEIMKNRANAKRGIKPKKQHDGYVVLKSEQYEFSHQLSKTNRETLTLWRTVVQSPIDIGIHAPEAKKLIHDAFRHKFGAKLGFERIQTDKKSLSANIQEIKNEDWNDTTYLLDAKYRQNTKPRLWEVTYVHNWPITIPEEMYAS